MTGTLRSSARNPLGIALMGVLVLVFLVLGVGGGSRLPELLAGQRGDAVVTAGRQSVNARQYARIFEQQKQKLNQQYSQTFTNEFLAKQGLDLQLLSSLAADEAQTSMLQHAGIQPAPELVDAQIQKIPDAFDPVSGKFSKQQFAALLANNGLTLRQLQEEIAADISQRQFLLAAAGGVKAPRVYAALNAVAATQSRDVAYFILPQSALPKPPVPTDADLLAFEHANTAQFTRPETRVVSLVRFSAAAIAPTIKIDPAQVEKAFEAQKDKLSTPETRTVVEIPARTAAQATQAADRLRKGEDPGAVARSLGVEAILYSDKPQSAVADKKLGAIAFAMTAGETRGPVQGDLGVAALKVVKITPAKTATLEGSRAKLEADLRLKAAQDKAYAMSDAFDTARQGGASLAAAAAKAGAPVLTVGPFDAAGHGGDGRPVAPLDDKMTKAAFATGAGEDSDVESASTGEYFALHVDRVAPPALAALDEARPMLTQAWQGDQVRKVLRAKVDAMQAQMRSGVPIDKIAADVGAKTVRISGMQLIRAQQYQSLGREFLSSAFGTKVGESFAVGGQAGIFVGKVESATPGDVTLSAQLTNAVTARLGQDLVRDLIAASRRAAVTETHASWNRTLALKAINVDPASLGAPAAPGKPS